MQHNIGREEINELVKRRERKRRATMWKEMEDGQGEGARGGIGLYLDGGFSPYVQVFGLSE